MSWSQQKLNILANALIYGSFVAHLDRYSMLIIDELLENDLLAFIARGRGREINRCVYTITDKGKQYLADRIEFD